MTETKPLNISGRALIVPVSDIDTDMIFHNRYLHITKREEMGQWIFGNLGGFEDFPQKARQGDILLTGHNFGCGSSRQQAVDGFIALGITAIIAESFGAIYKRNAINAGWLLMECTGITESGIMDFESINVNFLTGEISNNARDVITKGEPMTQVQQDIFYGGGLLSLAK